MENLVLHDFHAGLGARFGPLNGAEIVLSYGDVAREYKALRSGAAILDLGFRSRVCVTGADRLRFLHGQVTNDVRSLRVGEGCYAALITAKARMQSDLNIYSLQDEVLLDFEPGLTATVSERLEKYVIADDVQIVDVGPLYGLLSVVGPEAAGILDGLGLTTGPAKPFESAKISDLIPGEIYIVNQSHAGGNGFDLFIPTDALRAIADKLVTCAGSGPAVFCGWEALETARIEAGIPRFGADMDDSNIPLEAGLDKSAISFNKGCYIGQEIISRIRTYGQVAKTLRGLRVENDLKAPPVKGDKLFYEDKEVGYITSAVLSPTLHSNIALGYVRKEANQTGNELLLRTAGQEAKALIVETPFTSE